MWRLLVMASWLAFVAACAEQIEPERAETPEPPAPAPAPVEAEPEPFTPPARPSVQPARANIDWEAARADLAASGSGAQEGGFRIQSGAGAPPVPVLLPSGLAQTASAEGEAPAFRELVDGYLARYPGIEYDITVSGTNEVFDTGGASAVGEPDMEFRATATGGLVSLSRYGAGYLVEFECNGVAGAFGESCIEADEAMDVARSLVIAGTR